MSLTGLLAGKPDSAPSSSKRLFFGAKIFSKFHDRTTSVSSNVASQPTVLEVVEPLPAVEANVDRKLPEKTLSVTSMPPPDTPKESSDVPAVELRPAVISKATSRVTSRVGSLTEIAPPQIDNETSASSQTLDQSRVNLTKRISQETLSEVPSSPIREDQFDESRYGEPSGSTLQRSMTASTITSIQLDSVQAPHIPPTDVSEKKAPRNFFDLDEDEERRMTAATSLEQEDFIIDTVYPPRQSNTDDGDNKTL
jgi:hypothetical protein